MLLGAQHVQNVSRRINALAAGIIILGEHAHSQRLRLDLERFAQNVPAISSPSLSCAARGQHAFATCRRA